MIAGHPVNGSDSEPPTEFIVMTAASGNRRGFGGYCRVAVVQTLRGQKPAMISERARYMVRIVRTWESVWSGKTLACAYRRALSEARDLAADLNAGNVSTLGGV